MLDTACSFGLHFELFKTINGKYKPTGNVFQPKKKSNPCNAFIIDNKSSFFSPSIYTQNNRLYLLLCMA